MSKKILLVEDEAHKIDRITSVLKRHGSAKDYIQLLSSVTEAIRHLYSSDKSADIVILDIALPTFGGLRGGSGSEQPSGGIEIIRALQAIDSHPSIIIVTQYPEIVISGRSVHLDDISEYVREKYQQNVIAAIAYRYEDDEWEQIFINAMGELH